MVAQSYLSWISDQDLFSAISHVYEKYQRALKAKNLKSFNRNVIDPFMLIFDITLNTKDIEEWLLEESVRQLQKTLNNAVGEFHQIILGSCEGWVDLGTGDSTGVDLKKEDSTIFAEIKNKFNTMNSSSEKIVFNKLEQITLDYPNSTAYLVQIIKKPGESYDIFWEYTKSKKPLVKNTNPRIRKISGDKFYEKVTGKPDALKELCSILPRAIQDFSEQSDVEIELIEDRLIDEIKLQLNAQNLSSQELIKYFFEIVYPSSAETAKLQQLMQQVNDEIEDEFQEADGELGDNETE